MSLFRKLEFIKKYIFIFILLFLSVGIFVLFNMQKQTHLFSVSETAYTPNPERKVYIGFWTYGFWDDKTKSINPKKLEEIEEKVGKKVAIANYFRGWEHLGKEEEIVNELNIISANGWRPMVSTNPYFFEECPPVDKPLYRALADGDCDIYLHKIGKTLAKVDQPFFFRFAWEMNVNSMEWSIDRTGGTPEDFVNAWRRFYNILEEENAVNAIWVFSPQIETRTTTDIALLYPGNNYVDWVGLDGYNWGNTQTWSGWQSFNSIYYDSYIKLKNIAPNKPFMIAEVNTVSEGGNQAEWYREMLSEEIPNVFLDVDAIVFFNEDKQKIEGVKWLIDNSPQALEQFRKSIKNPIYKSTFE